MASPQPRGYRCGGVEHKRQEQRIAVASNPGARLRQWKPIQAGKRAVEPETTVRNHSATRFVGLTAKPGQFFRLDLPRTNGALRTAHLWTVLLVKAMAL